MLARVCALLENTPPAPLRDEVYTHGFLPCVCVDTQCTQQLPTVITVIDMWHFLRQTAIEQPLTWPCMLLAPPPPLAINPPPLILRGITVQKGGCIYYRSSVIHVQMYMTCWCALAPPPPIMPSSFPALPSLPLSLFQ